jgi:hydrogenase maturation protease
MNAILVSPVVQPARRIVAQILVCGSLDRGDDAAPSAAARALRDNRRGLSVKFVGQLDVDDLLAVPRDAIALVVDTALGIEPGRVVVLPLNGLLGRERGVRPRSSHALAIPEVVGVADVIRGHPLRGAIVVVGGRRFGVGDPMSESVVRAVPLLASTVRETAERLIAGEDISILRRHARAATTKGA